MRSDEKKRCDTASFQLPVTRKRCDIERLQSVALKKGVTRHVASSQYPVVIETTWRAAKKGVTCGTSGWSTWTRVGGAAAGTAECEAAGACGAAGEVVVGSGWDAPAAGRCGDWSSENAGVTDRTRHDRSNWTEHGTYVTASSRRAATGCRTPTANRDTADERDRELDRAARTLSRRGAVRTLLRTA